MKQKKDAATRSPQIDKDPIIDRLVTQSIPRDRMGSERRAELLRTRAATLRSLQERGWRHIGYEGGDYHEGSRHYYIVDKLVAPDRADESPRLYAVN
ncbi:hypothetical protein ACR5MH_0610 (plasmid) [Streptomyces sp. L7]|uniref:hypothetical protein n=1 Tax=Streptomyces sp. L7 TaxID=3423954 RepID=UPI00389ABDFA